MRVLIVLVLATTLVTTAQAGTNYPALKDYPVASCIKPDKPAAPGQTTVQVVPTGSGAITTVSGNPKDYNKQVAAYNAALHAYTDCIRDYAANGQADMDQIRDKVNKAVLASQEPN